jgi:hypothetical protein
MVLRTEQQLSCLIILSIGPLVAINFFLSISTAALIQVKFLLYALYQVKRSDPNLKHGYYPPLSRNNLV